MAKNKGTISDNKDISTEVAQDILKKAEEGRMQKFRDGYIRLCQETGCQITGRMIITTQGNNLELVVVLTPKQ